MKATIEFNLPDDQNEFRHANKAMKYYNILRSLHEFIKYRIRKIEVSEEAQKERDEIFDEFCELLTHENIDLYES